MVYAYIIVEILARNRGFSGSGGDFLAHYMLSSLRLSVRHTGG